MTTLSTGNTDVKKQDMVPSLREGKCQENKHRGRDWEGTSSNKVLREGFSGEVTFAPK